MMEFRYLKYFVTLAEELNFSRAAARLHISQPPLTRQIQQLEAELGCELFFRGSRGVELTLAGQSLLKDALGIMSLVGASKERACKAGRGEIGKLEVGIFGSAILSHIPRILFEFRNLYPEVEITLHQQTKAEQIQALRERRLTIGFNRHIPVEPDIIIETIFLEPLVIALHNKHPLARHKSLRIAQIVEEPLILYPRNTRPGFADDVMALFRNEGSTPRITQEVTDVVTSIALVSSGFGICVAPQAVMNLKLPGVVYRPIKATPAPTIEFACLYRREDESPILAAILKVVRKFKPSFTEPCV